MNSKDRERLRYLAARQLEFANSPKNSERIELWKRHNMCKGERPPIHLEVQSFAQEAIVPFLQCEDEEARRIEQILISNFINMEQFDDDKVVPPYFQQSYDTHFTLFGNKIERKIIEKEDGTKFGQQFEHIISDLEEDFDKIKTPSVFGVDKEGTMKKNEFYNDLFGDILPVKLVTHGLYCTPTQNVVHMMGMENMFYALYDYPDLFKEMMDRIADSYIAYFKLMESENILMQNHSFEWVGQGTVAFYDEEKKTGQIKTNDIWGFMDSQESVGIAPDMFSEFIFPCYKKIASIFGRLSYGCCEGVHAFWEDIKTLPNLKKVSISPWCDEDFMAQQLRGSGIIYHRKPSPNFLGVGTTLDEDAIREHFEKTIKTARGCNLEITQRDVCTINNDLSKARRYVEIIRETIDKYWE